MSTRSFSAAAGTALILAAAALLAGCAPLQCGDARVTRSIPYAPWKLLRPRYVASLPPVSLSEAGVTEFHVDNLPVGPYDFGVHLTGILPDDRLWSASFASRSGRGETIVSIRATAYDDGILFKADLGLRDLRLVSLRRSGPPSAFPASGSVVVFRIIATVIHPLPASDAKLYIQGFAPAPAVPATPEPASVER